jgi:ADP-ribose pyrophosphatase YjhB (NUDIX family)
MWEETGVAVRLTKLVGVFGGPDFIVRYKNGDRTSYVMTVFEALVNAGEPRPDQTELIELRFATESGWESLSVSKWVPEVLEAVFGRQGVGFRAPSWVPPSTE